MVAECTNGLDTGLVSLGYAKVYRESGLQCFPPASTRLKSIDVFHERHRRRDDFVNEQFRPTLALLPS